MFFSQSWNNKQFPDRNALPIIAQEIGDALLWSIPNICIGILTAKHVNDYFNTTNVGANTASQTATGY